MLKILKIIFNLLELILNFVISIIKKKIVFLAKVYDIKVLWCIEN